MANPKGRSSGEFKAPPSAKEVQAKAPPVVDVAKAHEAVFGSGTATVSGPDAPKNWREQGEVAPVAPKFIADPGDMPEVAPEPEFTDEDKALFLRSILSGKPFRKPVSLFDGFLKAVFRTRTATEAQEIVQLSLGKSDDYELNLKMELSKGHLAYGLVSIEDETGKIYDYDTGDLPARLERIVALPYPKYSILDTEIRKFDRLVDFFILKANQPGFWRPVAGT